MLFRSEDWADALEAAPAPVPAVGHFCTKCGYMDFPAPVLSAEEREALEGAISTLEYDAGLYSQKDTDIIRDLLARTKDTGGG